MRLRLTSVCLVAAGLVALLLLVGPGAGALFVLPAVFGLLALAAGWFPGEDTIAAIARRRMARPQRGACDVVARRPARMLGVALAPLAACAAGRAPPVCA